jgi:hypothetical protein
MAASSPDRAIRTGHWHASQFPDRPGSRNVDLSVFRTFAIQQNFKVQFRVEAFHAFNFVNLGNPRANIGAGRLGVIDTAGDARVMQLGIRMTF